MSSDFGYPRHHSEKCCILSDEFQVGDHIYIVARCRVVVEFLFYMCSSNNVKEFCSIPLEHEDSYRANSAPYTGWIEIFDNYHQIQFKSLEELTIDIKERHKSQFKRIIKGISHEQETTEILTDT